MSAQHFATALDAVGTLAQSDPSAGVFAGFGALIVVVWVLVALSTVFWVWMLVDCLGSTMPTNEKILWAVVMLVAPLIGSVIYFAIRRGKAAAA